MKFVLEFIVAIIVGGILEFLYNALNRVVYVRTMMVKSKVLVYVLTIFFLFMGLCFFAYGNIITKVQGFNAESFAYYLAAFLFGFAGFKTSTLRYENGEN